MQLQKGFSRASACSTPPSGMRRPCHLVLYGGQVRPTDAASVAAARVSPLMARALFMGLEHGF